MNYTHLGRTGLKVSRLCLGTMNFGDVTDEKTSARILDEALEAGINFIDTADVYGTEQSPDIQQGSGLSEEIIGRWLQQGGRRERIVLATKVYQPMGPGPNDRRLSAYPLIVDALKKKYPVAELLSVLQLARSCYFYHKASKRLYDKYAEIRVIMADIFEENYRCYGYRRLHAMLRSNNRVISEKVVRRLMAEEQLVVKRTRRRRYNSYCGEIGPAPENLLARDFSSCRPNEKWLTDITEFQLPAGKFYLSPVIDCFDGQVVSWSIGTRPDATLVNTMLDDALDTLSEHDKPVIHSDRGGHYRWPGWLERINTSGLIRSMSRKGCSSDNAACEGFFGRIKNEMFYGRDWAGITLEKFICFLDRYIRWYNEKRIKLSLGAMSPVKYRQHLGITT